MQVLVIGGSVFLGRAMVDEALAAGHDVTVLNRGRSGPPRPGTRQVTGDRTDFDFTDLGDFDLVIDTCGYVPVDVARSAGQLAAHAGHYAFVSSINAYPGWPSAATYWAAGTHAGDPTATAAPEGEAAAYGWLKVGCELAAVEAFGAERVTVLRAGCIAGPHDSVIGRLPWWIDRVARGGEVLVPAAPTEPLALVDARDLAQYALLRHPGTVDLPGAPGRDTWADLLAACVAATGAELETVHVDGGWLAGQEVEPWTEVPLWAPDSPGLYAAGPGVPAEMRWRPLAETVHDTWRWQSAQAWRPTDRTPGLAPERERSLIAAYRTR